MAVDMSNVKQIMHNNKEVIKIEDSLGHIIWQKESPVVLYEGYYLRSYSSVKDTNYIDFGFKWNSQWRIEGYYYRPSGTIDYGRILGTGWDTVREIQIDYPSSGTSGRQRQLIGNSVNNQVSTYTQNTFERYGFACGNRGSNCESWYWTNSRGWNKFGDSWSNSLGLSNYNLRFFSCSQGDRDGIYGIGNIKIMGPNELWDDAGALYYFVPAMKGEVYGMFDKINNTFYPVTTSGNGYFRITDVNGNVIQPSPEPPVGPAQWHTLWSGSRQIKATGSHNNNGTVTGNGITLVNAVTIPTDAVQLRITFTNYSASGSGYQEYISYTPSTKQSSPYTVTKNVTSTLTNLIGAQVNVYANNVHTAYVRSLAMLQYSFDSNHQLTVKTKAEFYKNTTSSGSATAQITITKIEAYY